MPRGSSPPFLTHLSWRIRWAFLIKSCRLSIVDVIVVAIVVNFSHFHLLFQNQISTKLGTKHPWVKGIQVCSNKGPHPFPRGDNYEITTIHWQIQIKKFLLQNCLFNFNQTWHNLSMDEGNSSLLNWRAPPFSKGRLLRK